MRGDFWKKNGDFRCKMENPKCGIIILYMGFCKLEKIRRGFGCEKKFL